MTQKQKINASQIDKAVFVCPYCMSEVSHDDTGCCGESSAHFETGYIVGEETLLESQIEIVNDTH